MSNSTFENGDFVHEVGHQSRSEHEAFRPKNPIKGIQMRLVAETWSLDRQPHAGAVVRANRRAAADPGRGVVGCWIVDAA
jgi:hypothetical protein